jgi:hypothetical protein
MAVHPALAAARPVPVHPALAGVMGPGGSRGIQLTGGQLRDANHMSQILSVSGAPRNYYMQL